MFDAHGVTQIVAVKANGRKHVLRITTKSGHQLEVTADHLVWRAKWAGYGPVRSRRRAQVGDQLSWHRTDSSGEGEISQRWIAEAALAGWLQADGFCGRYEGTNRSLTIEAMTVTPAELDWVTSLLDVVFPEVHRHERIVATEGRDTRLPAYPALRAGARRLRCVAGSSRSGARRCRSRRSCTRRLCRSWRRI